MIIRPVVPCGETELQTDRHDEANSRFSQICGYTLKGNACEIKGFCGK